MIGAFAIGLLGSFHCVGMCGPVMLSFMGSTRSRTGFFLYHMGRIFSYLFIGGILGMVGATLVLFQLQQALVFLLGFALLLLYGIPSLRHSLEAFYYRSRFYSYLRGHLAQNISTRKRWFLSGAINGFFPCGLTYVAAAGAVAHGDLVQGAFYMTLFGLGTLPALLAFSFAGKLIIKKFRFFMPGVVTVLAIFSGSIMMLRGLITTFPAFNDLVQAKAAGLITVCGL